MFNVGVLPLRSLIDRCHPAMLESLLRPRRIDEQAWHHTEIERFSRPAGDFSLTRVSNLSASLHGADFAPDDDS